EPCEGGRTNDQRRVHSAVEVGRGCVVASPQRGIVASLENKIGQAWSMGRSAHQVPVSKSSFGGFRFSPDVITIAVRWYLRYGSPTETSKNWWLSVVTLRTKLGRAPNSCRKVVCTMCISRVSARESPGSVIFLPF